MHYRPATLEAVHARLKGAAFAHVALTDFNGLLRGKMISAEKARSALAEGFGFAMPTMALDPTDVILGIPGVSTDEADFNDCPALIDPASLARHPFQPPDRDPLLIAELGGKGRHLCTRQVYRRVHAIAAEMGFMPRHGVEYEFTVFAESAATAAAKGYAGLAPAHPTRSYLSTQVQAVESAFYGDLVAVAEALGAPLEGLHEEMGQGFREVALAYGDGVEVADKAVLFKTFAKAAIARRGLIATFMARWSNEADGQSGHIHLSLIDREGAPVFHDPAKPAGISDTMRWFIGGLQHLVPEFLALMAPHQNSFKRYDPGIFAPTAAIWGIENRTCAFRAIGGGRSAQRVENRVPGADANPYLSLAATLAAGLYGIERKIEPDGPVVGNAYARPHDPARNFPRDLGAAIDRLERSAVAARFFGADFIAAFVASRRGHDEHLRRQVTDADRRLLFELA